MSMQRIGNAIGRAFGERRLLLGLWLANLVLALALVAPLAGPLKQKLDHSLLARDHPFLSGALLGDLTRLGVQHGSVLGGGAALVLVLALLLQLFLAGGVVLQLLGSTPLEPALFARDCVRLFGRNLRLFGWALLGLIPMLALLGAANSLLNKAESRALFVAPFDPWRNALAAVAVVALVAWRASFDRARVFLVMRDLGASRVAAWHGLRSVLFSPLDLLAYLILVGLGWLTLLGVAWLHARVPVRGTAGALIALAVAQLVIAVRMVSAVATVSLMVEVQREAAKSSR